MSENVSRSAAAPYILKIEWHILEFGKVCTKKLTLKLHH